MADTVRVPRTTHFLLRHHMLTFPESPFGYWGIGSEREEEITPWKVEMSTRKEAQSVGASEPTPKSTLSFLEPQSQLKLASFFLLFSSLSHFFFTGKKN